MTSTSQEEVGGRLVGGMVLTQSGVVRGAIWMGGRAGGASRRNNESLTNKITRARYWVGRKAVKVGKETGYLGGTKWSVRWSHCACSSTGTP